MSCCHKQNWDYETAKTKAYEYTFTHNIICGVIEVAKGNYTFEAFDKIQGGVNIFHVTELP